MTAHSDITVTPGTGEYAPGTMPRQMAEVTGYYIRELADHPAMAGPHSTWLMGAYELIGSLLHCLDLAQAEANSARAGQRPVLELPLTLASKLANLVAMNRKAAELGHYSTPANVHSVATDRLHGLAMDPELDRWAWGIHQAVDCAKQDAADLERMSPHVLQPPLSRLAELVLVIRALEAGVPEPRPQLRLRARLERIITDAYVLDWATAWQFARGQPIPGTDVHG